VTRAEALLAEALDRPFTGWDFSWLADRMTIEPPWDYTSMVVEHARRSPDLLDMGTGGGEWLVALPTRPPRVVATEAWPPNVALAARRVRSIGGALVRDEGAVDNEAQAGRDPRGRLPFRDGGFHLVVNRHEAFVAREVARVLTGGGVFLTQQVDNANLDDCREMFGMPARPPERSWLARAVEQIEAAGMHVDDARTGSEAYYFADVGALAWYLKAVAPLHRDWADFDVADHRDALERLDERALAGEHIEIHQRRLLVRAHR
jgi:SAM-dependent methyltransferase